MKYRKTTQEELRAILAALTNRPIADEEADEDNIRAKVASDGSEPEWVQVDIQVILPWNDIQEWMAKGV